MAYLTLEDGTVYEGESFGAEHDDLQPLGDVASASYIRRLVAAGRPLNAAPFLPPACYAILGKAAQAGRCPASVTLLERALLARFREMEPSDWLMVPGVSEGLENRLADAARQAAGWTDLLQRVKTKRYPLTRLQRLLWAARAIPLVSRPGRIETLGEAARQIWRLENRAADLYALALPEPYPCGAEYTAGVIRLE